MDCMFSKFTRNTAFRILLINPKASTYFLPTGWTLFLATLAGHGFNYFRCREKMPGSRGNTGNTAGPLLDSGLCFFIYT